MRILVLPIILFSLFLNGKFQVEITSDGFENETISYSSSRNGAGDKSDMVAGEGLELTAINTVFTIDFDNTVPRVNEGSFGGVHAVPSPSAGQLNSNAWSLDSVSYSQPAVFGFIRNSGGGVSTGNVNTPTYYAFETSPGNMALGVQPSNIEWNEGNITLKVQNNTGSVMTSLALSYKVSVLNNTNGADDFSFAYSTDNLTYGILLSDTSINFSDGDGWKNYLQAYQITGLSVPNGGTIYLRWIVFNYFSSIESDELAWDDISIVANPTTVFPRVSGNFLSISSAYGPVQLSGNTTVEGNIDLYGHNIQLGNYDLTIGGAVIIHSPSYLQTNGTGSVIMNNVTGARLIPVGASTYNPITISNGSGLNWSVRVSDGISNTNNTDRAVLRTWIITPSTNPPPNGANITFQYNDGDPSQIDDDFNTAEDVELWHDDGFGWINASGGLTPTGSPGGVRTVTLSNWTDFSSFAITNVSGVLPVEFGPVKARRVATGVNISWLNYTETDVLYYSIERSNDSRNFSAVGRVNPVLNNGQKAEYNWLDQYPVEGNSFYRIVAIENNGKKLYSIIVRLNAVNSKAAISIYPNPLRGASQITLQLAGVPKGNYELTILSASGQKVYAKPLIHDGGSVSKLLVLPANIKAGFYVLSISNADMKLQANLIY